MKIFLPRLLRRSLSLVLVSLIYLCANVSAERAVPYTIPPVGSGSQDTAPKNAERIQYDQARLIAGHVLRRIGFGPNPMEMKAILEMGPAAYISQQLNPISIDDSFAESKLPPKPRDQYDYETHLRRWFIRMTYSRRQLREKMTLIWHEHFATSIEKVSTGCLMNQQEEFLRKNALGNFKDLLIGISKDKAMLVWLDNNYNNGQAYDDSGKKIPPNENYAREFLQLFSMGTAKLKIDGTAITNANGVPVKSYSETDVREVARAMTGFYHDYKCGQKVQFYDGYHDPEDKMILGTKVMGRAGKDGAREVEDVVTIVMRNPNVAPFISKILIQKLATETPTAGYVSRVASVFARTGGDIKSTVAAILADSEFYSNAVILSQYKEPVEQFVGAVRALEGTTEGGDFIGWTYAAAQLPYFPPSVFSFYPPGQKATLVNSALVIMRDRVADEIVSSNDDTVINPTKLMDQKNLKTPDQVVDYLSDALLAAPLQPEVRKKIIAYMQGTVSDEKFRGAAWLILCSPDFSRN